MNRLRASWPGWKQGALLRDVVALVGIFVLGFVVASQLDLFEVFEEWSRAHENLNIDEIVMAGLLMVVALAAYSWRRYRVARSEINRRDRAERALDETIERNRSLFQYNPHAVYSLDLDGRFEDVNPALERLIGYPQDVLRGMDSTVFATPEENEMARATLEDIAAHRGREFDTTVLNKDGEEVELRITSVPIVVGGVVVGLYGMAEDVTASRQMQRDLESVLGAAEDANKAKSLFLANVSHELRTPLTSVLAATELLGETRLAGEQTRLLDMVDRSGQRLLRLIEEILDFSRIEAGKTDVDAVEFDMRAVVADLVEFGQERAERKGLDFECTLDPDVSTTMVGDPARVFQVLTNLLGNAIKFTDTGSVRLRITDPGPDQAGDRVLFTVSDTGIGMTDDQLDRLFQSFTQADSSITRRYGGTGLGLAISKELVILMGGSIQAESVEGSRSSFTVVLPRFVSRVLGRDGDAGVRAVRHQGDHARELRDPATGPV